MIELCLNKTVNLIKYPLISKKLSQKKSKDVLQQHYP